MPANYTPEEISNFLEQFFNVVGTRQYIGARYVPMFGRQGESSVEWDNSAPYEPLTVVLYQGNSYTSRTYVPTGALLTDTRYWVETGNYSGQIEAYRAEVISYKEDTDELIQSLQTNVDASIEELQTNVDASIEELQTNVNSINDSVEILEYSRENGNYIDSDSLIEIGTINRVIEGHSCVPQSMCYADGYLYVGFADQNSNSYLARVDKDTLQILRYVKVQDMYCHFNSLSIYKNELFTTGGEATTYQGNTGVYIAVFDKDTLALKRVKQVSNESFSRWSNFIIGENKQKPDSPVIQCYNDYYGAFIDYGTFYKDGTSHIVVMSYVEYMINNGFIADGCVVKVNAPYSNVQNVFAYISTSYQPNQNPYQTQKNKIILVQPNGYILPPIILPKELDNIEMEGITCDDAYIYVNTVTGTFYKFAYDISNFVGYRFPYDFVRNDMQCIAMGPGNITGIGLGIQFTNGWLPRRFYRSALGYLNHVPNPISFAASTETSHISVSNAYEGTEGNLLQVTGVVYLSVTNAAMFGLTYEEQPSATNSTLIMYELTKMRLIPLVGSSVQMFARDNIQNDSDETLITQLNNSGFSAIQFQLGLFGKNVASAGSSYQAINGLLV